MGLSREEYEALGLQAFVKNDLVKKLKKSAKEIKRSHQNMRDEHLHDTFTTGGESFLKRAKKYAKNERGVPLRFNFLMEELLTGIGDFRIGHTLTTGPSQCGKSQPLDAKLLTPSGWIDMLNIQLGDYVISGDGTPTRVIGVYPQGELDVYEIVMDDGTKTRSSDDHLWLTQTAEDRAAGEKIRNGGRRETHYQRDWIPTEDTCDRPGQVKTLKEIRETLHLRKANGELNLSRGKVRANHSIQPVKPIQFDRQTLPLDPYLVGALLGDGCLGTSGAILFSNPEEEILDHVRQSLPDDVTLEKKWGDNCDWCVSRVDKSRNFHNQVGTFKSKLEDLGLYGKYSYEKYVPDIYKFAATEDRLAMLQGIMDTDGTIMADSACIEFASSSERFVEDVRELVLSLGGICNPIRSRIPWYTYKGERREGRPSYRMTFKLLHFNPFRVSRKANTMCDREPRRFRRYIKEVNYVGKMQCQCIAVEHPSRLYVTDNYIVTHNTLSHSLLAVDSQVMGRLNVAWIYDTLSNLQNQMPLQYKPILNGYLEELAKDGITFNRTNDREMTTRVQVENVNAIFAYASTSRASVRQDGTAAAGSAVVSFTADMAFLEERSQWSPGAADPIPRRLDASVIESKPIRELGTSGSGSGIEQQIKMADNHFYPYIVCPHCGEEVFLDPRGCVLKRFTRTDHTGQEIETYLSESGRPVHWFHKDSEDPINSAYIGCSHCGMELDYDTRQSARFKCLKTNIKFVDYIAALPQGNPPNRLRVGFHLSTLGRDTKNNIAAEIIRTGLECVSPEDFIQQVLGHPSEISASSLNMSLLMRSMESPKATRVPEVRLCGIDQGRSEWWIWIQDIVLPHDWKKMSTEEVIEKTVRQVVWAGDISERHTEQILKDYRVNAGCIDNEPSRSLAAEYQRKTVLKMVDQIDNLSDVVKKGEVEEGGTKAECYKIRNQKFMRQVLMSFLTVNPDDGYPLTRLPSDWKKWASTPVENSPLRHLMSPRYDNHSGRWTKGDGIDHLWYSMMFAEIAFYLWLTRDLNSTFVPGALVTVEKPQTSSYTLPGYGGSRPGRSRGSFIPGVRRGR